MQSTDVIVGSGISAHAFLWTYALALKQGRLDDARRVVWIKSEIVPTCSLTSTSLISRAGLSAGVSELGDILLNAYELFESYQADFNFCEKAVQKHLPYGDLDNFKRRYGDGENDCYVIRSKKFLLDLAIQARQILGERLLERNGTVCAWDEQQLSLYGDEYLKYGRCFLGLGAGILLGHEAPAGTRAVSGSYAQSSYDLGDNSFVLSKGPMNFIYRASDRTILLGSIDDKNDRGGWPVSLPRGLALKAALDDFSVTLPRDLRWQVFAGVRHKGQKRRPFWGMIHPNLWTAHSFYKNGYTVAFLAAQATVKAWINAKPL